MTPLRLTEPSRALDTYLRRFPARGGPDWVALLVAQDFGLLDPFDVLRLIGEGPTGRPGERRLALLVAEGAEGFEPALWAACREATGGLPRPGTLRWAQAQDRWRVALLEDLLEAGGDAWALGRGVVDVYEALGCPEDMLGLWRRQGAPRAERSALEAFVASLAATLPETLPTAS